MDDDVAFTFAGIFGFALLYGLFCLAIPYYVDARDWYYGRKSMSEMMEIYNLKDTIIRVEQNIAKDEQKLGNLKVSKRNIYSFPSWGNNYAVLLNSIKDGKHLLYRLKKEHNRRQWKYNGFLMGTSLQKELLL